MPAPENGTKKKRTYREPDRGAQGSFLESMTLLISAGIDPSSALTSAAEGLKDAAFRKRILEAGNSVTAGVPLWKALQDYHVLPAQRLWLIRIGEETGQLSEHLSAAVEQHRKESLFRARIQSAMMYPAIVALVGIIAGLGVAWFILPRLVTVFSGLNVPLPLLTRMVLQAGKILSAYGIFILPGTAVLLFLLFTLLFVNPSTKKSGELLLMALPGISGLVRDSEIARFGHVFGSLLKVGVPVPEAMEALSSGASFAVWRELYSELHRHINAGGDFAEAFASAPKKMKLMPLTIQHLLATAGKTGRLSQTALQVGVSYEGRLDLATKNLTVILEPIMLFVVWIGVVLLAVAIVTPLYSVLQGINR